LPAHRRDGLRWSRSLDALQPVPVAASGQTRRGNCDARSQHWTRHVASVAVGIVAGYAVIALMVALLALS
jgi:hypothetical protein